MPTLTFPVDLDGMMLPVLIGLNGNETAARAAAAQSIPLPVSVKGIVDTGTNVTCVTQAVLSRLAVAASGQGTTNTAAGEAVVQLYEVRAFRGKEMGRSPSSARTSQSWNCLAPFPVSKCSLV